MRTTNSSIGKHACLLLYILLKFLLPPHPYHYITKVIVIGNRKLIKQKNEIE